VIEEGSLHTVQAPTDDPQLVPAVTADDILRTPATRGTLAGTADEVRVMTVPLPDGSVAVFAISTDRAADAARRLMFTLAIVAAVVLALVALVAWWVIRLGLRPIRKMTEAADAISAGATGVRIDIAPGPTEAARLVRH